MGFAICGAIKKCIISRVFSACNFIKYEAPAQVFSFEFWETLLKKEIPEQVSSCEFCRKCKSIYYVEHLQRIAANDMIIGGFFTRFIVHQDVKEKDINDNSFLNMSIDISV